mmetsp:Transcript_25991/g.40659  ORF Transcript_25991/g.40659 Transcript_25991/m.40659 type:complete len:165 (+) Transcript_25991:35-529(+)
MTRPPAHGSQPEASNPMQDIIILQINSRTPNQNFRAPTHKKTRASEPPTTMITQNSNPEACVQTEITRTSPKPEILSQERESQERYMKAALERFWETSCTCIALGSPLAPRPVNLPPSRKSCTSVRDRCSSSTQNLSPQLRTVKTKPGPNSPAGRVDPGRERGA